MTHADELLEHLANCPACILAKAIRCGSRCHHGQRLVRLTLIERHGTDDER